MPRRYCVEPLIRIIPFILYFLVSCSPGNDPVDPIPVPENCSLKSELNAVARYTIFRNDKGLPVRLEFAYTSNSLSSTCFIEYDAADNIVKMSQENGYFNYEYDGEGRPISREWFIRSDSSFPYHKTNTTFYRYNGQGQIDSAIYDIGIYDRYEYGANGNVIKTYFKNYGEPEVLSREYLAFDDKKNPAFDCNFDTYTILGPAVPYQAGINLPWISNHNVLSENVRLVNGSVINRMYTFDYNDLGYPTYCKEYDLHFSYDCK